MDCITCYQRPFATNTDGSEVPHQADIRSKLKTIKVCCGNCIQKLLSLGVNEIPWEGGGVRLNEMIQEKLDAKPKLKRRKNG